MIDYPHYLLIRTYSIIHMYYITTVSRHIFILQSCEVKDKNVNPSEFFQPFGSLSQRQPPVVSKSQIFPARQKQDGNSATISLKPVETLEWFFQPIASWLD